MSVHIIVPGAQQSSDDGKSGEALTGFDIEQHESIRLVERRRGDAVSEPIHIEAQEDDVLELRYASGLVDFRSAGDFSGRLPARRGAPGKLILTSRLPRGRERGEAERIVKEVIRYSVPSFEDLLKDGVIDAAADKTADVLARAIVTHFEDRFWNGEQQPGLHGVTMDLGLHAQDPVASAPMLLLIHGTFSSTRGAFGALHGTPEWEELYAHYEGRVHALDHKTLGVSPVRNALDLVTELPKGARLHLLTHSRGGLVGDLLSCREIGQRRLDRFARYRGQDGREDVVDLRRLSALLDEKDIVVERFVRVACPAAGTLLASCRLDRLVKLVLNVVGLVPVLQANPVYAFLKALAVALVGKKADPSVLPGLEAQMPDSPLVRLLNTTRRRVDDGLAVVAGDVEGSGLLGTLKVLAADLFYREDHDLVVNTKSMYRGLRREQAVASFQRGADVSHSAYFGNAVTRGRVLNALVEGPDKSRPPIGFEKLPDTREGVTADNVTRGSAQDDGDRRVVVFVPGQCGSRLGTDEGPLWGDTPELAHQGLGPLGDLHGALVPQGLVPEVYRGLVKALEKTHTVVPFAYDWRRSYADTAEALAALVQEHVDAGDTVSILAHSGGGLAVHHLAHRHPELWKKVRDERGQVVLLATPIRGSFAVFEWMLGLGDLVGDLHRIDPEQSPEEVGRLLATFPGLLELLPETEDFDPWSSTTWERLGAQAPDPKLLEKAADARASARASLPDLRGAVVRVAGRAPETPAEPVLRDAGLTRMVCDDGDGFMQRASADGGGRPTWCAAVPHAQLAAAPLAGALVDLLRSGMTDRLDWADAAASEAEAKPRGDEVPRLFPSDDSPTYAALGGEPDERESEDATVLEIEVVHGSLEHAKHAVMLGHYEGTTLGGAEGFVDRKLGGLLSRRQALDLYPGPIGTTEVVWARDRDPGCVLVLGLGSMGDLTPQRLAEAVTQAAVDYAVVCSEREPGCRTSVKINSLLIGSSGRHGMSIPGSVAAIVKGIVDANLLLSERGFGEDVQIGSLQFIERYAGFAEVAARTVREIETHLVAGTAGRVVLQPQPLMSRGEGGYAGSPDPSYEDGSWARVLIQTPEKRGDEESELEFISLGRRARADAFGEPVERGNIDERIEVAVASPDRGQVNNTLYEMLVPNELKQDLFDRGNLMLVVDEFSARYPWEMMASRNRRGELEPFALRGGMLRQLRLDEARWRMLSPKGADALVIGDPDYGGAYPQLAGARTEAQRVAKRLESHDYHVKLEAAEGDEDPPGAGEILDALFEREYRILHIAAHGHYDADHPDKSGVVIGDGRFLTPLTIRKLRVVPELVFLNCCHLGRTEPGVDPALPEGLEATRRRLPHLAASVSVEFMKIGVRAVIAAGWAVDDEAAAKFATTFYDAMFVGHAFGEAVTKARRAVAEDKDFEHTNTWGAYQCYGDPGYRLVGRRPERSRDRRPVARHELVKRLERVEAAVGDDPGARPDRLSAELERMDRETPPHWRDGEVQGLLGKAYGALGDYERAVRRYRSAVVDWGSAAPIKILEQLGNMEVRWAVQQVRAKKVDAADEGIEELFKAAKKRFDLVLRIGWTPERLALRGSYHKKRATILSGKDRDDEVRLSKVYYKRACDLGGGSYQVLNAATMAKLAGRPRAAMRKAADDIATRDPSRAKKFWDRVAPADGMLARALLRDSLAADEGAIRDAYAWAFGRRSTIGERGSVLEHLADLEHLVPSDADKVVLKRLRKDLSA